MPIRKTPKSLTACALSALAMFSATENATAATYVFAGEANGVDVVTHAGGYNGTGGSFEISVGIDMASLFASEMAVSVQNVINTWNALTPTVNNVQFGQISANAFDFESVLLHEMGHALGLGHTNLASESNLPDADQDFAMSTDGANNTFDLDAGRDTVIGSADDNRGDDVNLNLFRIADNDPFATDLGVIDSTTYSRDLADLPRGDNFAASAGRAVANHLGYGDTEAVMQQGTQNGETQRTLAADDVVGVRYAQSGVDEIAGTADDYTFTLNFIGEAMEADILIGFDNAQTSFASTLFSGTMFATDHTSISSAQIFFNSDSNWFFNEQSNNSVSAVPLAGSAWSMVLALAGLGALSYRRRSA